MGTPVTTNDTTQSIQHKGKRRLDIGLLLDHRSRAWTSINRLSLHSPSSFSMHQSSNNCPGYPYGRLSVVKHRQLARQVWVFGAITIKSSMDFDDMIFLTGSTFIFGSWVWEANDEGNLHGCLIGALEAHMNLTLSTGLAEDLAKKFSGLTMPESTHTSMTTNLDLVSGSGSSSESNLGSFRIKSSSFLIRLQNVASTL
jgi:hypothetical protein